MLTLSDLDKPTTHMQATSKLEVPNLTLSSHRSLERLVRLVSLSRVRVQYWPLTWPLVMGRQALLISHPLTSFSFLPFPCTGLWGLSSLLSPMHQGRPSLFHLCSGLHYDGPFPPSCQWLAADAPLKEVDLREEFHSSSSTALGVQLWLFCADPFLDPENASLRVGGTVYATCSGLLFSSPSR